MGVKRYSSIIYVGLSGDTKPSTDLVNGARFLETDTLKEYVWDGTWNLLASSGSGGASPITGAGQNTYLTLWTSNDTISFSNDLYYNNGLYSTTASITNLDITNITSTTISIPSEFFIRDGSNTIWEWSNDITAHKNIIAGTNSYNIGSPSRVWNYGYFNELTANVFNGQFSGNFVTSITQSSVVFVDSNNDLKGNDVYFKWDNVNYRLYSENIYSNTIRLTPLNGGNPKLEFYGTSDGTISLEVNSDGSLDFVGNSGTLFSISDDLTGALISANNSSGFPVLQANADNSVLLGQWGANTFNLTSGQQIGIGTVPTNFKLEMGGDIGPDANNARSLGSVNYQWANVWSNGFKGTNDGTNPIELMKTTTGSISFEYWGYDGQWKTRTPSGQRVQWDLISGSDDQEKLYQRWYDGGSYMNGDFTPYTFSHNLGQANRRWDVLYANQIYGELRDVYSSPVTSDIYGNYTVDLSAGQFFLFTATTSTNLYYSNAKAGSNYQLLINNSEDVSLGTFSSAFYASDGIQPTLNGVSMMNWFWDGARMIVTSVDTFEQL